MPVGQPRVRLELFRRRDVEGGVKFVAVYFAIALTVCACVRCHTSLPIGATPVPPPVASAVPTEQDPPPYLPDGCIPGDHDVRSWKRVDPATVPIDQHFALNYSPCTWTISIRSGVPTASQNRDSKLELPPKFHLPEGREPPRVARQGRAGVLLGYNRGEWGGSLLWCSDEGSVQAELLDDNVVTILSSAGRFVVLAGLSHLGFDRGRVLELTDDADGFHPSRTTELGSAPTAAAVESSGAILITTMRGLVRLTSEFHVHRLRDSDWGMFYPATIVVDQAATAYIGVRGIVAEIKLDSDPPRETWLFPI